MESKETFNIHFVWKDTINDGSLPIRRFGDGPAERASKAMKNAPNKSKSDLIEQGLVKNIKKSNAADYVDE